MASADGPNLQHEEQHEGYVWSREPFGMMGGSNLYIMDRHFDSPEYGDSAEPLFLEFLDGASAAGIFYKLESDKRVHGRTAASIQIRSIQRAASVPDKAIRIFGADSLPTT